ncbi:MAG: lysophospholipid acyltransferase family protein [bacterium]
MKGSVQRLLTSLALRVGHVLLLGLGRTWRFRVADTDRVASARAGGAAVIYAFSHGVLLPLAYGYRGRGVHTLVSRSRDGEIIATILARLGFRLVRGSSSRGGARAVLEMTRMGRRGEDLAITPDGPRGPLGSVAPGVGLLARRTGLPIVPIGVAATRGWRARSWDRFLVPKPGARVWITYGAPIRWQGDDDSSEEPILREIGEALAAAERRAQSFATGESPATWERRPA